jgi:hypothetical protein
MSIPFTRYLSDFASGFIQGVTQPKGVCADWRHASRLFVDDTFRLAPRHRFAFYVKFDIDEHAANSSAFTNKIAKQEVGMLVKSADMPKVTFDTVIKNQYNRKKVVYTGYNYDPVTIKLHDDADGVTNAMWAQYYGYYIADRHTAKSTSGGDGTNSSPAYGNTKYSTTASPVHNYRYGLDNNITTPFFKSVTIYSMSRGRFLGYTLVNPRIKYWAHGTLDHAANDHLESTMSLEYESVIYTGGNVSQGSPGGFSTLHYDMIPSPLSVAGGGSSTLGGPGGLLAGMEQIFGDISNGSAFGSIGGLVNTAATAYNMINNAKKMNIKDTLLGAGARLIGSSVSGNMNTNFPNSALNTGVVSGFKAVTEKINPNGNPL